MASPACSSGARTGRGTGGFLVVALRRLLIARLLCLVSPVVQVVKAEYRTGADGQKYLDAEVNVKSFAVLQQVRIDVLSRPLSSAVATPLHHHEARVRCRALTPSRVPVPYPSQYGISSADRGDPVLEWDRRLITTLGVAGGRLYRFLPPSIPHSLLSLPPRSVSALAFQLIYLTHCPRRPSLALLRFPGSQPPAPGIRGGVPGPAGRVPDDPGVVPVLRGDGAEGHGGAGGVGREGGAHLRSGWGAVTGDGHGWPVGGSGCRRGARAGGCCRLAARGWAADAYCLCVDSCVCPGNNAIIIICGPRHAHWLPAAGGGRVVVAVLGVLLRALRRRAAAAARSRTPRRRAC